MTVATLTEVRAEIAAALGDADCAVYATIPATPVLPCLVVMYPNRIEFNRTAGGHREYDLVVSCVAGLADVDSGQDTLDELSSVTVPALLEAHTTSVWRALNVTGVENYRAENYGDAAALVADVTITLIA